MSEWIITTAITLGIGVITYFLKRTMSQVDKHGEEIRRIDSERVTKTDLKESTEELKKDIRQIREDYTPKNVHEKDFYLFTFVFCFVEYGMRRCSGGRTGK